MALARQVIDVDFQRRDTTSEPRGNSSPELTPEPRAPGDGPARTKRIQMSCAERLLNDLLDGMLSPASYNRVMPFHCLDPRYKKCEGFMRRFYPLGFGGFSPGPSVGAFGDAIATLCFLTADGPSLGRGASIAAIIGEHQDCGFSRMETGSKRPNVIEARTLERTDSHLTALFGRTDIVPALRTGRLSIILTRSTFLLEKDGSYSVAYEVMPERTNKLLKKAKQPELSTQLTEKFSDSLLLFGHWGAREKRRETLALQPPMNE